MQKTLLTLLAGCGAAAAAEYAAAQDGSGSWQQPSTWQQPPPPPSPYGDGSWVDDLAGLHGEHNETWPDHFFSDTAPSTIAINDTFHLAWDGDVVEYVNTTHHVAYDLVYDSFTQDINISSHVMSHEDHNITFLPGGPTGTMAVNDTHHITPFGTIVEEFNSTHHFDDSGVLTSHIEANLTREYHGLTDDHIGNLTINNEHHELTHLFTPPPFFDCNRIEQTLCLNEFGSPMAPCEVPGRPCEEYDDVSTCYWYDCNPPAPPPAGPTPEEIDLMCEGYGLDGISCDIRELLTHTGSMLARGTAASDDFYRLYCKCAMTLRASAAGSITAAATCGGDDDHHDDDDDSHRDDFDSNVGQYGR